MGGQNTAIYGDPLSAGSHPGSAFKRWPRLTTVPIVYQTSINGDDGGHRNAVHLRPHAKRSREEAINPDGDERHQQQLQRMVTSTGPVGTDDPGASRTNNNSSIDEEPLYVNAKQYHRILKRRAARARLEELHRLSKERKVCFGTFIDVEAILSLVS